MDNQVYLDKKVVIRRKMLSLEDKIILINNILQFKMKLIGKVIIFQDWIKLVELIAAAFQLENILIFM